MKVLYSILLFLLMKNVVLAQARPLSISAGLFTGVPIVHRSNAIDDFFINKYKSGSGFNLAVHYKIKSNWEFGFYGNWSTINISRKNSGQAIVESQSSPGYLYSAKGKGNIQTNVCGFEISKIFVFNQWSLAAFLRSGVYYTTAASLDLSLTEKVENEHYYKETSWKASAEETYSHSFPLLVSSGVKLTYQHSPVNAIYLGIQYSTGSLGFDVVKETTDFYDIKSSETISFQQQYSFISCELGYKASIRISKKNKPAAIQQ